MKLWEAKVVFNLSSLALEGDEPNGLSFFRVTTTNFAAYDRVRNWRSGNPYEDEIAALMKEGVAIEECG